MAKRQVEVFTAGCPLCEPAVQLVHELACPDCEVTVYDLRQPEGAAVTAGSSPIPAAQAARYGIKTVPTVVVDGTVCGCCDNPGLVPEQLQAAGIGVPLSS